MMNQYLTENITHTSKVTLVAKNIIVLYDKLLSKNVSII